jgi:putative MATE family efflux protein
MGLSAVLNMILDPIMIFGFMSIPAMGIQGAALATLMARAVSCIVALWFLHKKKGLIKFEIPCLNQMLVSWKEVLKIGLPSSLSSILMPISGAVVMYFISRHGAAAVAACSAAARLEMFAFMIPMTLGASLVPFTGQNFGADRLDRVRQGHRYANGFAFVFGIFTALFFAFFSDFMVQIFSKDPAVLVVLKQYLMIIPLGYGMMEIHRYSGFFLNGMKQPFHATSVNVFRIVVLLVPLSWAGSRYFGLKGIFFARLVTDVISGTTGLVWSYIILKKMKKQHDLCGPGYKEEGIYDISVKTVSASDSVLGPESLPQ